MYYEDWYYTIGIYNISEIILNDNKTKLINAVFHYNNSKDAVFLNKIKRDKLVCKFMILKVD